MSNLKCPHVTSQIFLEDLDGVHERGKMTGMCHFAGECVPHLHCPEALEAHARDVWKVAPGDGVDASMHFHSLTPGYPRLETALSPVTLLPDIPAKVYFVYARPHWAPYQRKLHIDIYTVGDLTLMASLSYAIEILIWSGGRKDAVRLKYGV